MAVNPFGQYRADMAARLTPAAPVGVTVTTDPAVGPPMILVDLVALDAALGIGAWEGTVPVKCVTGPPGDAANNALLEEMAAHVLAVLGFSPLTHSTYRPTAETALPMYELTYPALVPNPRC